MRTFKLLSILVTLVLSGIFAEGAIFRWLGNQQGYAPVQPINFSHKLHAGDNQISCLYCHSAAEKSKLAGLPATSVCLNCHSQIKKDSPEIQKLSASYVENQPIEWVKVHNLPNHVVFNHSRHVNAGMKCQQCHGPVETMDRIAQANTLSMGMCISCHRTHRDVTLDSAGKPVLSNSPARVKLQASTDCSVCHH
ncbi:MAG: cytochrome c3 family protein [Acidobacteriota bacterium]